jgi:hypothetical protein
MRRGVIAVAIVLAVGGIVFAAAPFARPKPADVESIRTTHTLSDDCTPPVLSAWRPEQIKNGSFTVLSSRQQASDSLPGGTGLCRPSARRHLEYTALFLLAAAVALGLARRPRASAAQIAPA